MDREGTVTAVSSAFGWLVTPDRVPRTGGSVAALGGTTSPAALVANLSACLDQERRFAAYLATPDAEGDHRWCLVVVSPTAAGRLALFSEPSAGPMLAMTRPMYARIEQAETAALARGLSLNEAAELGVAEMEVVLRDAGHASIAAYQDGLLAAESEARGPRSGGDAGLAALDAALGPWLERLPALGELARGLQTTGSLCLEVSGALGRITDAALDASRRVVGRAPRLQTTARALGALNADAVAAATALAGSLAGAHSTVARLRGQLAVTRLHADVCQAAAADPAGDPGTMRSVLAADTAASATMLDSAGRAIDAVRCDAEALASKLERFHRLAGIWRVQVTQSDVAGDIEEQLAMVDGRLRRGRHHIGEIRSLARTCRDQTGDFTGRGLAEACLEREPARPDAPDQT
jgi:hypothetical protein